MLRNCALILSIVFSSIAARGNDTTCSGQPCEETNICARPYILKCTDWNLDDYNGAVTGNGVFDGWTVQAQHLDRNGDLYGDWVASGGINNTAAFLHRIQAHFDETIFHDTGVSRTSIMHVRRYFKFSPNWSHAMFSGFQKNMYMFAEPENGQIDHRAMLGFEEAFTLGWHNGTHYFFDYPCCNAGNCNAVGLGSAEHLEGCGHGIVTIDLNDHHYRIYPGWDDEDGVGTTLRSGDQIVILENNQWYYEEFMVDIPTRSLKVWVAKLGETPVLTIQRTNLPASAFRNSTARFNVVRNDAWFGGVCCAVQRNAEDQTMLEDNIVIATGYIGPLEVLENMATCP